MIRPIVNFGTDYNIFANGLPDFRESSGIGVGAVAKSSSLPEYRVQADQLGLSSLNLASRAFRGPSVHLGLGAECSAPAHYRSSGQRPRCPMYLAVRKGASLRAHRTHAPRFPASSLIASMAACRARLP